MLVNRWERYKFRAKLRAERKNWRQRSSANPRAIFSLSDISDIMHLVFYSPIAPDASGELLSCGLERGDVEANFSHDYGQPTFN